MFSAVFGTLLLSATVLAQGCPTEWKCSDEGCFCFIANSYGQYDIAVRECGKLLSLPAMPKTPEKSKLLANISFSYNTPNFWIGLTKVDENTFMWADNQPLDGWTNWYPGHPTTYDCVLNKNEAGEWWNLPCTAFVSPLCEDIDECTTNNGGCQQTCVNHPEGYSCQCDEGYELTDDNRSCQEVPVCDGNNAELIDGKCITLFTEPLKWAEAKAACEALGQSLVDLRSSLVTEYIGEKTAALGQRTWLGATDAAVEGTWVWTSTNLAADFDPSVWGPGQPDNWRGNEDCLAMKTDKLLNDLSCGVRLAYFCA